MDEPIYLRTADDTRLALWPFSPGQPSNSGSRSSIILTHGTFSNHRVCDGLAAYLQELGFSCWLLDWRGHGQSESPSAYKNFDAVAQFDVPGAIDAVFSLSGSRPIYWIGHSGGGLAAAMWLAREAPDSVRKLAGVVLLAAQATASARGFKNRLAIRMADLFMAATNWAPGHYLGLGPEAESATLMRQWCRWNLTEKFLAEDGFDYLAGLSKVALPVLAIGGGGDRFIAPEAGCRKLAQAFGGAAVSFVIAARRAGFTEDYTHRRVVLSRAAKREIWPLIAGWLSANESASP